MTAAAPLVVALGDLLLDVVCRPRGPIAHDTDTPSDVSLDAGGQAANVVAWAVRAGARGRLVARLADDAAGHTARVRLALRGVEAVGPRVPSGGGIVVVLVRPDGARDMLTDRGAAPGLAGADLDPAWFADAAALHITGYALSGGPMQGAALEAAGSVHDAGGLVSVDCAGVALIEQVGAGAFRQRIGALRPDLALGTAPELALLQGAGKPLAPAVVEKRGADGVVLLRGGERCAIAAVPAAVVDTTGAGDALAGGLLGRLVAGAGLDEALHGAVADAAACVGAAGAMPTVH